MRVCVLAATYLGVLQRNNSPLFICAYVCVCVCIYDYMYCHVTLVAMGSRLYGVATISRLLKIIGLFCKRALLKRRYSAEETYTFKEPTNRSHPIVDCMPTTMKHIAYMNAFM